MQFNSGKEIVDVNGMLVEKDVLGIIERIKAYDPNLEVMYLDPDKADFLDAPWVIAERCHDGQLRRVFEVWELDERVLERIWSADTKKHDVQARMEAHNASVKQESLRRYKEKREEAKDIIAHIYASAKGTYTWRNDDGQLVKIDDDPKVPGVIRVNDRRS